MSDSPPTFALAATFALGVRKVFHRIDGDDAHDADAPCEECARLAALPPGPTMTVLAVDRENGTITIG